MRILFLLLPAFAFASTTPLFAQRIVGEWKVQKYESQTPDQPSVTLQNIGTITFAKKGKGSKDIRYSVMGLTKEDRLPFQWSQRENEITLTGEGSDLSKTWIVVVSKKKFQQWKSTDGTNQVQVLELIR